MFITVSFAKFHPPSRYHSRPRHPLRCFRPERWDRCHQHRSLPKSVDSFLCVCLCDLMVALMCSSIDSTVCTFAHYQPLMPGNASARDGIMSSMTGTIGFPTIARAFRRRHLDLVLSSNAAFPGSVLTIMVSGLYTILPVPVGYHLSFQSLNKFRWTAASTNISTAALGIAISGYVTSTYPSWAYDEVALP